MICVVCQKETEHFKEYRIRDVIIVPICKECETKVEPKILELTALVRQMRIR